MYTIDKSKWISKESITKSNEYSCKNIKETLNQLRIDFKAFSEETGSKSFSDFIDKSFKKGCKVSNRDRDYWWYDLNLVMLFLPNDEIFILECGDVFKKYSQKLLKEI